MVQKIAALLIISFIFSLSAQAQSKTKAKPPLPKPSDVPVAYSRALCSSHDLCVDSIDLTVYMPPVGNQFRQNSCAAWALGYACRSYYNSDGSPGFFTKRPPAQDSNIVSPAFIYNTLNNKRWDSELQLTNAMRLMKDTGACSYKSMPYTKGGFNTPPNATQIQEAKNFKIEAFGQLNKVAIIDEIRGQLRNKQPVIVNTQGAKCYFDAGVDKESKKKYYDKAKHYLLDNNALNCKKTGGHAIVILGFDDRYQAFKFMNSMGTEWGNKGYGWMSYNVAPKVIWAAYVIKPRKQLKPLPSKVKLMMDAPPRATAKDVEHNEEYERKMAELQKRKAEIEREERKKQKEALRENSTPIDSLENEEEENWLTKLRNRFTGKDETSTQADSSTEEPERANRFTIQLEKIEQTDTNTFDLNLNLEVLDCVCDSYQVMVLLYWGDVPDRNKKGAPVSAYNPDYSLANGQAAIILDKEEFAGIDYYSTKVSIPLDQIAIPKSTVINGVYTKTLHRLVAEAVWFNDDFAIKSCSTIPIDVYY